MTIQAHIKLDKVDKICILTGNPDRVEIIASHLDKAEKVADHRGLVAFRGVTRKKAIPVTVLSTGMGSGSISIVLEEAYRAGAEIFIRIGSAGALQPELDTGTIFLPNGAIRDEGTTSSFAPLSYPAVPSAYLYLKIYDSATKLGIKVEEGVVWSTDVYYHPDPNYYQKWADLGAKCVEMEISSLFVFGAMRDIQVAGILTADGNLSSKSSIYNEQENVEKYNVGIEKSIQIVMAAIEDLW